MSSEPSAPSGPVVTVVGNPQAASRTATVGGVVADRIASLVGTVDQQVVDLATVGPALLEWGAPTVEEARRTVREAAVVVVASPTFKATYTGLLKLFLDRFDHGELRDVAAVVPLMTGGGPAHSLAVDVHLRPLLVELGARMPTAGLYVWGPHIDDPGPMVDEWWATEAAALGRAVGRPA